MGKMEAKKLPDFSKMTLEEIARFWDEHDSTDYWDQMKEAKVEFKEPLDETLSIKIHSADLARLKALARKQGLGHTTLVRAWIKEKLEREMKKKA